MAANSSSIPSTATRPLPENLSRNFSLESFFRQCCSHHLQHCRTKTDEQQSILSQWHVSESHWLDQLSTWSSFIRWYSYIKCSFQVNLPLYLYISHHNIVSLILAKKGFDSINRGVSNHLRLLYWYCDEDLFLVLYPYSTKTRTPGRWLASEDAGRGGKGQEAQVLAFALLITWTRRPNPQIWTLTSAVGLLTETRAKQVRVRVVFCLFPNNDTIHSARVTFACERLDASCGTGGPERSRRRKDVSRILHFSWCSCVRTSDSRRMVGRKTLFSHCCGFGQWHQGDGIGQWEGGRKEIKAWDLGIHVCRGLSCAPPHSSCSADTPKRSSLHQKLP